MKKHEELNRLVVANLAKMNDSGIYPTARELFFTIQEQKPELCSRGIRSFGKLIGIFDGVEKIPANLGFARVVYKLKK